MAVVRQWLHAVAAAEEAAPRPVSFTNEDSSLENDDSSPENEKAFIEK